MNRIMNKRDPIIPLPPPKVAVTNWFNTNQLFFNDSTRSRWVGDGGKTRWAIF